jgi:hypothetical protein
VTGGPPTRAQPTLALVAALACLTAATVGSGATSSAQEGPVPVLGRSVNVALVSGTVLVRPRGQQAFHRLLGTESIPTGSTVDTRRGRVRLTSAVNTKGRVRTSEFWAGLFRVRQRRKANAITDLILNGRLENCGRASAAARRRKGRRLWGNGKGKFRTRGRRSAALVRGTKWLVYDQCDSSTYNAVRTGRVDVRDFRRRKIIRLKAGQKYIAR